MMDNEGKRKVTIDLHKEIEGESSSEEDEEKEQPKRPKSRESKSRPNSSKVERATNHLKNKLDKDTLMKADSDEIDLDALLKAVIDISDRLHDQEEKLKADTIALKDREQKLRNREYRRRPKTAVLHYGDEDSNNFLNGDLSDDETVSISTSEIGSVSGRKSSGSVRGRRPISGRPLSGRPSQNPTPIPRLNMSFSNDTVKQIDKENQRLLKEILRSKSKGKKIQQQQGPVRAMSHAEMNRVREQQRIERENLAFLHRLESVKPTRGLSRDELIQDHMKSEERSGRIAKVAKSRPSSATSQRSLSAGRAGSRISDNGSVISSSKYSIASTSSKQSMGSRASSASNLSRKSDSCSNLPSRTSSARSRISARSQASQPKVKTVAVWESGW